MLQSLRRHVPPVVVAVMAIVVIWSLPELHRDAEAVGLEPVDAARGIVLAVDADVDPVDGVAGEPEGEVLVRVLEGPRAGEELRAFVALPFTQASADDFEVGEEVIVTFTGQPDGPAFVAVGERWRLPVIGLLVLVFAAAIVLVGGWQGLRALLALALTVAVVIRILIPAILEGLPPIPLAILVAGLITVVTILLTEGLGRVSLAAILGTVGGLAIAGVVSALVGLSAEISGAGAGELYFVQFSSGAFLDTRGLLLAAIIIGAVGVLDDMTVTQASTVERLAARPVVSGAGLWRDSLRIGRSHVAATVNTLFMAYVGASLPALVFLAVSAEPLLLSLNREVLALEIVRTLAGSLGIVLAMPLTTAIAIALMRPASPTAVAVAPSHPQPTSAAVASGGSRPRMPDAGWAVTPRSERRAETAVRPRAHGIRRRSAPRRPDAD